MEEITAVQLSRKALAFVEQRRNGLTLSEYLNLVLENLSDQASQQVATAEGARLVDLVEKGLPAGGVGNSKPAGENRPVSPEAIMIYQALKSQYGDVVPCDVFELRCREAGIPEAEIAYAKQCLGDCHEGAPAPRIISMTTEVSNVTLVLYELTSQYRENIPREALHEKCKERGLSEAEVRTIEKIYAARTVFQYNEMVSDKVVPGTDFKESVLDIKIIKLLDELKLAYGNLIPATAYMDRCVEMGFGEEDLVYARKKYSEFIDALISYEDVKYINFKAYIVLNHLKKSQGGKVPYNLFYSRCRALGISKDHIEAACSQAGGIIDRSTNAGNVLDARTLTDAAADYAKEQR